MCVYKMHFNISTALGCYQNTHNFLLVISENQNCLLKLHSFVSMQIVVYVSRLINTYTNKRIDFTSMYVYG